jgi:hypothetical protein
VVSNHIWRSQTISGSVVLGGLGASIDRRRGKRANWMAIKQRVMSATTMSETRFLREQTGLD